MARNHAVFAAIALSLMGLSASASAQSQQCTQDTDCALGNWCVFDGGGATEPGRPAGDLAPCASDDPDCANEPPIDPEPVMGVCEPLPKGLCVEQSDCSQGLECVIGTVGIDCAEPEPAEGGGAAPGTKQNECVPSQEPSPYGYCSLPITVCSNDSMCLPGLRCVQPVSGGGEDPGAAPPCEPGAECDQPVDEPTPDPEPEGEATCQVSFETCTVSTDCDAGYECFEQQTGCSSSGSGGSDGTVDPEPKQRDPNCDYESYCFPKYTPCANDAQCQANWTCFSFDGETNSAPDFWNQNGPVQACLPKGLALAAEAGYGRGGGGVSSGSPTGVPESDSANDDGTKGAGATSSGDSCSVGFGPSAEGAGWLTLCLGILLRRRRTRAHA